MSLGSPSGTCSTRQALVTEPLTLRSAASKQQNHESQLGEQRVLREQQYWPRRHEISLASPPGFEPEVLVTEPLTCFSVRFAAPKQQNHKSRLD